MVARGHLQHASAHRSTAVVIACVLLWTLVTVSCRAFLAVSRLRQRSFRSDESASASEVGQSRRVLRLQERRSPSTRHRGRARPSLAAAQADGALPSVPEAVPGVDGMFLVTTAGSEERRDACLAELGDCIAALRESVAVRTFERDVQDGARGCYTSHLVIYREALRRGLSTVLILEDNLAAVDMPADAPVQDAGAAIAQGLAWARERRGHLCPCPEQNIDSDSTSGGRCSRSRSLNLSSASLA
eukprot:TRINITY_DN29501_c0_g1_i4.p1 TRINITY_DN29501_c0_g1~~TRINITY_DN29501_c0_g1_i4.p1  ORF type:complete len:244 (+),score=33.29 TRINITY_DN29501_c0_g1_i4:33-764(+)